jgi:hypothetical protein
MRVNYDRDLSDAVKEQIIFDYKVKWCKFYGLPYLKRDINE